MQKIMTKNFYDWPAEDFIKFCDSLIIEGQNIQAPFPYCIQLNSHQEREDAETSEKRDPAGRRLQILECLNRQKEMRMPDLVNKLDGNHQATMQHCRILHQHKLVKLYEDDAITIAILPGWKGKIGGMEKKLKRNRN